MEVVVVRQDRTVGQGTDSKGYIIAFCDFIHKTVLVVGTNSRLCLHKTGFIGILVPMQDGLDSVQLHFGDGSMGVLTASLALVMFGVALNLQPADFRRIAERPLAALAGLLAQFVALPALTVLLIWAWRPAPSLSLGMLLVACCPGGNLSNFMSLLARGNVALSVTLTAMSSSLALFLTPFNFLLWGRALPTDATSLLRSIDVHAASLMPSLVLMLALPLLLGMFFAQRWPRVAVKIEPWVRKLSLLVFFSFVVGALVANGTLFRAWWQVIMVIVAVHNALALMTGYAIARGLRLPESDRRSLAIETGIQNAGLGLVLVLAHFEGLGGMALMTAWWGVWHIVSGLVLAFYWRRQALPARLSVP
jgi:BASS family bile acid:Na+ symporter